MENVTFSVWDTIPFHYIWGIMFSNFSVFNVIMMVLDVVWKALVDGVSIQSPRPHSLVADHLYNGNVLKWGKWSVYLLAFDSPWRICRPPHVTLELFECCRLPVCRHLPQHIIHHFSNGLLLICVNRLVHGMDRTRPVLFHVFFNLPQQYSSIKL